MAGSQPGDEATRAVSSPACWQESVRRRLADLTARVCPSQACQPDGKNRMAAGAPPYGKNPPAAGSPVWRHGPAGRWIPSLAARTRRPLDPQSGGKNLSAERSPALLERLPRRRAGGSSRKRITI